MIDIDLDDRGERIRLTGGYTPGLSKAFPGASFSRVGGAHWSLPLTMKVCRGLRKQFGGNLRVGTALSAWAYTAIEREQTMASLAGARDADLLRVPEVSPKLAAAMANRTYQRVGARYVAEGRSVLLAAEPGLGKTLMAIGGVIESGVPGPYLVVCPKTAVRPVWVREVPRWYPGADVVWVPDGRPTRGSILAELYDQFMYTPTPPEINANTWVIMHPNMIWCRRWWVCPTCEKRTKWKAGKKTLECVSNFEHDPMPPKDIKVVSQYEYPELFGIAWGAIVMDESDRILVRRNASQTFARNGAEELPLAPDGLRIAMSGTPFRGKPPQLWGTLNWLRPKVYTNQWKWTESYWDVKSTWGGGKEVGQLREDGESDLYKDLDQIMLRQTKIECAPDMPAKTYVGQPLQETANGGPSAAIAERDIVGVWLPMDPAQQRVYDQMRDQGMAAMEGGEVNAIGMLAELTRLKQFATAAGRVVEGSFVPALPSNKFDYLVEMLEEWGFPDEPAEKVVVVSQFTQVLEMMAFALGDKYGKTWHKNDPGALITLLTGNVTGDDREAVIDDFNRPLGQGAHVMFLNVKAGGVAITLDSADHMVFLDQTWIPDDQEQTEDRIHRVSRPRPVFYHYLRSLDSIDEHIAAVNMERALASHAVLDGRRGLEYAQQVVAKVGAR